MTAIAGNAYIGGPTFEVAACRGRRFVVRSIKPLTVNVLGKHVTTHAIEVAFLARGRVQVDALSWDEWADVLPVPS